MGVLELVLVVSPLLRIIHAIVQYKLMSLLALIYLKDISEFESFSWKRAKCFEVLHESFLPFQSMFALLKYCPSCAVASVFFQFVLVDSRL